MLAQPFGRCPALSSYTIVNIVGVFGKGFGGLAPRCERLLVSAELFERESSILQRQGIGLPCFTPGIEVAKGLLRTARPERDQAQSSARPAPLGVDLEHGLILGLRLLQHSRPIECAGQFNVPCGVRSQARSRGLTHSFQYVHEACLREPVDRLRDLEPSLPGDA